MFPLPRPVVAPIENAVSAVAARRPPSSLRTHTWRALAIGLASLLLSCTDGDADPDRTGNVGDRGDAGSEGSKSEGGAESNGAGSSGSTDGSANGDTGGGANGGQASSQTNDGGTNGGQASGETNGETGGGTNGGQASGETKDGGSTQTGANQGGSTDLGDADTLESEPNDSFFEPNPLGTLATSTTVGGTFTGRDFDYFSLHAEPGSLLRVTLLGFDGPSGAQLSASWRSHDMNAGLYVQDLSLGVGEFVEFFMFGDYEHIIDVGYPDGMNDSELGYLIELEIVPVEPTPLELDVTTPVSADVADLVIFDVTAELAESQRFLALGPRLIDVAVYDVGKAAGTGSALGRDEIGDDASGRRWQTEAGGRYYLVASMRRGVGEPREGLEVAWESLGAELEGQPLEGALSGEIAAPSALGVADRDFYALSLEDGESVRIEVEGDDALEPYLQLGLVPHAALPVGPRAAMEVECHSQGCVWDLEVGDARNLGDAPQGVGGSGFGYTVTMNSSSPVWQSIELPFEDTLTLPDVGSQLRFSSAALVGGILVCEATDPSGRLDLFCERGLDYRQPGELSLLTGGEIVLRVRDSNHRGMADAAIDVSIRSVPVPADAALVDESELVGQAPPMPARITGPATPTHPGLQLMVPVSAGEYVIALGATDDGYASLALAFDASSGLGRAIAGNNGMAAAFRAESDGEIALEINPGCSPADVPCSGSERYDVTLFVE